MGGSLAPQLELPRSSRGEGFPGSRTPRAAFDTNAENGTASLPTGILDEFDRGAELADRLHRVRTLQDRDMYKAIDQALKEHYRETMECKRVPSDYLLMFTEGGESNAVADAIIKAQIAKAERDNK